MSAITLDEILRDTDLVAVLVPAKAGVDTPKPRPTFVRPLRDEVRPTPIREAVRPAPLRFGGGGQDIEDHRVDLVTETVRDQREGGLPSDLMDLIEEQDLTARVLDLSDTRPPFVSGQPRATVPTVPVLDEDEQTDGQRRAKLAEVLNIKGDLTDENLEG